MRRLKKRQTSFPRSALFLLIGILMVSVLCGIGLGSVSISPTQCLKALWHGISGEILTSTEIIVWQLRFPRVIMGLLVGANLAMCGAAYQGLFRNPLADPYLMGVASGAYLGAVVATILKVPIFIAPIVGMISALISVFITLLLARRGNSFPTERLILAGVVVGSILTSLSTFLLLSHQAQIQQVYISTLGHLALSGWTEIRILSIYTLIGVGVLLLLARALNMVSLGDATARSLGVPIERLRLLVIVASSISTSAAVGLVGIIGFVGLITPHIVRRLWGADLRMVLPLSGMVGGILLIWADLVARTVMGSTELPVGLLTALLGGIFF